jgi:hypothetical protein
MSILICLVSLIRIAMILLDGFEAILLPRRVSRWIRFTAIFYRMTWIPFKVGNDKRGWDKATLLVDQE